jgi:hypothetical protein
MDIYRREVKNSIDYLVDKKGKFQFGTYSEGIKSINMIDAKKPFGFPASKRFKNFRLKEWEAFQAGNDNIFILGAIYNTKATALNQLLIYDKIEDKLYNYRKFCAPWKQVLSNGMYHSESKYISKVFSLTINNNLDEGTITIKANIKGKKDLPDVSLDIVAFHTTEPIVICQPFDDNRGLYSHKALMKMEGKLIFGEKTINFSEDNAFTIIDDHKGYYPFTVKYDWLTGCINNKDKGLIGFNLTNNQIKDHNKFNENCLWANGKMNVLPPVKFRRGIRHGKEVWIVQDKFDKVNIRFYPLTKFDVKFNYGLVYSDYEGPMGKLKGYIKDNNDKKIMLDNFFGMGEKKRYRI